MLGQKRFLAGFLVLFALASFMCVGDAMAATNLADGSGSFTGLLDLIKQGAEQWDARLRNYAVTLFWLLAGIQFVWTFFPLVFRQADFGEIIGELIRFVMVIGFFYALLIYSSQWAYAIVDSFREAGAAAAGVGTKQLMPGDMFGIAVELADMIGKVETWNPLTATIVSLAGVIVLLCFAFIAAFMALTVIESYVVVNASVLFMGLGGSQWTRDYAIAIFRYALAVGAKLFILTLIVGLISASAKQWQAAYNHDDASMWTMVGLSLACAYLSKTIPELIAGMISGTSMGGGASIGGMAAAAIAGAVTAGAATAAALGASGAAGAGAAGAAGAAGGTGAAGAAGAGAAGSVGTGGLAGLINSSIAGGQSASGAGSAASAAMDAGSSAVQSVGSRLGGGGTPSSGTAPSGSATLKAGAPNSGQGGAASGPQQAAKTLEQAKPKGRDGQADAPQEAAKPKQDAAKPKPLEKTAAAAVRTTGILSAISVPGMEGAAGLSLGPVSSPPVQDSGREEPNFEVDEGGTIRPADPASVPEMPATPVDPTGGSAPASVPTSSPATPADAAPRNYPGNGEPYAPLSEAPQTQKPSPSVKVDPDQGPSGDKP
ncbi:P-type conjugative transfer protein TrbL [Rhizobium sp. LCM 4573]|uniref:P-type conjugative transfer protein TrbL n=1 Tax=Rhizobium sp. LCM 4573 TaxID=1848291 RepID=UPI0008D91DF2|nr:P-type conjugative transfer protein TrbL [Rhizobium sp. LCM 4573]OHV78539.1 P-type conjugative transfer protein TrbL [Rhizobium sp. LCM 4573]